MATMKHLLHQWKSSMDPDDEEAQEECSLLEVKVDKMSRDYGLLQKEWKRLAKYVTKWSVNNLQSRAISQKQSVLRESQKEQRMARRSARPGEMGSSLIFHDLQDDVQREQQEELRALEKEMMELGKLFKQVAFQVVEQRETVKVIEQELEEAEVRVEEAKKELSQAAKYALIAAPAVGATLGGLLFGPLGVLVGIKGLGWLGVTAAGVGLGAAAGNQAGKAALRKAERVEDEPEKQPLTGSRDVLYPLRQRAKERE